MCDGHRFPRPPLRVKKERLPKEKCDIVTDPSIACSPPSLSLLFSLLFSLSLSLSRRINGGTCIRLIRRAKPSQNRCVGDAASPHPPTPPHPLFFPRRPLCLLLVVVALWGTPFALFFFGTRPDSGWGSGRATTRAYRTRFTLSFTIFSASLGWENCRPRAQRRARANATTTQRPLRGEDAGGGPSHPPPRSIITRHLCSAVLSCRFWCGMTRYFSARLFWVNL